MTIQNKFESVTIAAGADLSLAQHKAIAVGGTIAATSVAAFGLLQNKPSEIGIGATVGYSGIMKAKAGAAISAGAGLAVTNSGFIITVTSGSAAIGKALVAANSGDMFQGLFNFAGGYQP
jgi:uncharacterized membrane protein